MPLDIALRVIGIVLGCISGLFGGFGLFTLFLDRGYDAPGDDLRLKISFACLIMAGGLILGAIYL